MPLTFDEVWGLRGMLNLGLSFLGLFVLFALGCLVFAKLASHVVVFFEQPGDRRVFFLHSLGSAGQTDLRQAGAHR